MISPRIIYNWALPLYTPVNLLSQVSCPNGFFRSTYFTLLHQWILIWTSTHVDSLYQNVAYRWDKGKLSGNHPRFSNYELHLLSLLRFSVRSRGTTKRHYFRVRGDTDQPCVSAANRIARKVAYMLEYHFAKGVFYVLENPMSSLLWRFKCVQRCLERHSAKRDVVHLGCYGANTMKPVPSFKQRCWQA